MGVKGGFFNALRPVMSRVQLRDLPRVRGRVVGVRVRLRGVLHRLVLRHRVRLCRGGQLVAGRRGGVGVVFVALVALVVRRRQPQGAEHDAEAEHIA